MNKNYLYIALVVVIAIFLSRNTKQPPVSSTPTASPFAVNRGNCIADDCLLVEGLEYPVAKLPGTVKIALDKALDDEYKAFSTYQAIIAKFGSNRPFSMIIGAEDQHISQLKAIYTKYGESPITNKYLGKIKAPASLAESCAAGVQAEIDNAGLYRTQLLPQVSGYQDITQVFTSLMNASENKHLPAFNRCTSK